MNLKCQSSCSPQAGNHLNGFVSRPKGQMSQVLKLNGGGNVVSYPKLQTWSFCLFFTNIDKTGCGHAVCWSSSFNLLLRHKHFWTSTRILCCDKRTYDCWLVMCYDLQHIWLRTTAQGFDTLERWTKATSRHQPLLLGDPAPYLWRMAPIRRSAPPLYFVPCAQILVVPKILRNCQMLGVAILTRGRVQVVMVAKLAVGGRVRRRPIWGQTLMEAYLCNVWTAPFRAVSYHHMIIHFRSNLLKHRYFGISIVPSSYQTF